MLNSIKKSYPQAKKLLAAGGRFTLDGARSAASFSTFELAGHLTKRSPLIGTALLTGATALHVMPKNKATGIAALASYPMVLLGSQYANNRINAQEAAKAPKGTMHDIKKAAHTVLKTARKYPVPAAFATGIATISAYNIMRSDNSKKK